MRLTHGVLVVLVGCGGAPVRPAGSVVLSQVCDGERCTVSASAVFSSAPSRCTKAAVAGCRVTECERVGDALNGEEVSAGDIEVAGLRTGPLTLRGGSVSFSGRAWEGGETLTVSAPGGVVPAFSAELVAPREVKLEATGGGTLRRGADFTVLWDDAPMTPVSVTVMSAKPKARWVVVSCTFATSPAVVPAAALKHLHRSDDGYTVSLMLTPAVERSVVVGEWDVGVSAETGGFATFLTTSD
ncbi:MAG: hypothetical protein JNK82_16155 [Myxococcaceae bacterium]|nr:hypothetical protein [Myxococcaceae bacterium]